MTDWPPYWTPADEAEAAAVSYALAQAVYTHRERCPACKAGKRCPAVAEAYAAVERWARGRHYVSRATWEALEWLLWLRELLDRIDGKAAA